MVLERKARCFGDGGFGEIEKMDGKFSAFRGMRSMAVGSWARGTV